jgi:hypothetical protein
MSVRVREEKTYEGCVDVAFEQCNPRVAFISRIDVFVTF